MSKIKKKKQVFATLNGKYTRIGTNFSARGGFPELLIYDEKESFDCLFHSIGNALHAAITEGADLQIIFRHNPKLVKKVRK